MANSIMKRGVTVPVWVGVLCLCILLTGCSTDQQGFETVELSGKKFVLELALDDDKRFQGLSDREEIPADGGMLFVFPESRQLNFVMRRCLVPIDLIFVDSGGRVVAMHAMEVEPYATPDQELKVYSSRFPAQFAIELAGGTLETLGLEQGDKVDLPLDRLKAQAR